MKIVELLVAPGTLVPALLLAGTVAAWLRRPLLARTLASVASAVLLVVAVPPWRHWLLHPLEDRFAPPAILPERVDGVIVLGGAFDPVLSAERGQPSLNGAAERIVAMAELARRFPMARMIFTGGSGSVTRQDAKEAPVARAVMHALGIPDDRIVYEGQSRNTWENALYSKPLAGSVGSGNWLLVTSALHMPRAVGAFRAAGWRVIPYPVDYLTSPGKQDWGFEPGNKAGVLSVGMHEWAGLAYYRIRGWSESWYPAP